MRTSKLPSAKRRVASAISWMGRDWRMLTHALTTNESSNTVTAVMKNNPMNVRHIVVSARAPVTASTKPTVAPSLTIGTPTTKCVSS